MEIKDIRRVVVIGAGGTGSMLLPTLSRHLYTQGFKGTLIIVDGDKYSEGNIERQIFSQQYVDHNKAQYQAEVIINHIPAFADNVSALPKYATQQDIHDLVVDYTVVFNCVDNLAARKYVEDRCLQLNEVAHICCGNEKRNGQVQISLRRDGEQICPSIYDEVPQFNNANDDRSAMNCQQLAALPSGGQWAVANMYCATLAMVLFYQLTSDMKIFQNGYKIPAAFLGFDIVSSGFERASEMNMVESEELQHVGS